MKNFTMAVPDETLERFRSYAADRRMSVNALVRRYMEDASGISEERRKAAVARMIARAKATPLAEYAPPLTRDQLWDRHDPA